MPGCGQRFGRGLKPDWTELDYPLLWWLAGDRLDDETREVIAEPSTFVMVSGASIWEIAIKRRAGKLRFEGSACDEVRRAGFDHLAVTGVHAEAADDLPPHHRDPFDRMFVAQAQIEGLTLGSRDPRLEAYDVAILRC